MYLIAWFIHAYYIRFLYTYYTYYLFIYFGYYMQLFSYSVNPNSNKRLCTYACLLWVSTLTVHITDCFMSYLSPCYMPGWHASVFLHWSGLHRGPSHGQSGHHHAVLHIFRSQRGRKDGNIMAKIEGWYYSTCPWGLVWQRSRLWADPVFCSTTICQSKELTCQTKKGPIISWQSCFTHKAITMDEELS